MIRSKFHSVLAHCDCTRPRPCLSEITSPPHTLSSCFSNVPSSLLPQDPYTGYSCCWKTPPQEHPQYLPLCRSSATSMLFLHGTRLAHSSWKRLRICLSHILLLSLISLHWLKGWERQKQRGILPIAISPPKYLQSWARLKLAGRNFTRVVHRGGCKAKQLEPSAAASKDVP